MAQLSTAVFTFKLFCFLLVLLNLPNDSTTANSFTANEDGEMNQLRNYVVSTVLLLWTLKYFEFSVFFIFNQGYDGRKNPATGNEINLAGGQRSTACNMFFKFISTLNYSHCELLWQANLEDKVARLELSLQQEKDFCSKRSWFSSVQLNMYRIDETLDLIFIRPIGNH